MKKVLGTGLMIGAMGILWGLFTITSTIDTIWENSPAVANMTIENYSEEISRSCIIYSYSGDVFIGCGSGSLMVSETVLTAAHVVTGADRVLIEWSDGVIEESTEIKISPFNDVAFIKTVQYGDFVPACDGLKDLDEIYCVGSPFCNIKHSVIMGKVIRNRMETVPMWVEGVLADLTAIGGMSGGACYHNGELIGILVGYIPDRINSVTVIVPVKEILDDYYKLIVLGEEYENNSKVQEDCVGKRIEICPYEGSF